MRLLQKTTIGLATAFILASTPAMAEAERFELDKEHTTILFLIKHAGFSSMIGQFRKFDGYMEIDRENPEKSVLHVNIDPASIQTSSTDLDHKLRSEKFFDTDKYSNIHFSSTEIKRTGDDAADVTGDLRMHGAVHPVTLSVTMNKEDEFYGKQRIGFSARGSLKRSDYAINEYIPLVSDEVELIIEAEGMKDLPEKTEE